MDFEKLSASFNLDDLITELLARQLVQQAHIETIQAIIAGLEAPEVCGRLHQLPPKFLSELYQKALQQRLHLLRHDNPLVHAALQQIIRQQLGGIDGVSFSDQ